MKKYQPGNIVDAAVLSTGDEVLTGDVVDSNAAFMSKELTLLGVCVQQKRTVGDDLEMIMRTISDLSNSHRILVVSGGMGATLDDLTVKAASLVSGRPLIENGIVREHLTAIEIKRQINLDHIRERQCLYPEGAKILANSIGIAPGFYMKINRADCYFLPGVPKEMRNMFLQEVLGDLKKNFQFDDTRESMRFFLFGIGESQAQGRLLRELPSELLNPFKLGFRADSPFVEVKLGLTGSADPEHIEKTRSALSECFKDYIFSHSQPLNVELVELLRQKQLSLVLAESCTGGRIASLMTEVPGASEAFKCGLVTYSNQSKEMFLGVKKKCLDRFGAVSREVAESMARGILETGTGDMAIAVSGIAGPGGGTTEKPVGTVFIAFGSKKNLETRKLIFPFGRTYFQKLASYTAIDLLRRKILGLRTNIPYYFDDLSKTNFS
ncbi:MAG: CinA family nicotinamide mononucleotide deamidase-related protein [Deltaproteobacteria bacterium]|nr:CinA family nicotinamide mononucleotide deamidase-related protein [Deltaproteobacteria bacterium]